MGKGGLEGTSGLQGGRRRHVQRGEGVVLRAMRHLVVQVDKGALNLRQALELVLQGLTNVVGGLLGKKQGGRQGKRRGKQR